MRRRRPISDRYTSWRGIYRRAMRRFLHHPVESYSRKYAYAATCDVPGWLARYAYVRMGRLYSRARQGRYV